MALRVAVQYLPGSTLGYSIKRLSDGYYYNFTTGAFVASQPSTSDLIATLPALAAPYSGRYEATLTPTPQAQFSDGFYSVTVHDTAASNNVVMVLQDEMASGDDLVASGSGGGSGGGGGSTGPELVVGLVEANSSGSALFVSNLPAGSDYRGQRLEILETGERRRVSRADYDANSGFYSFTFAGRAGSTSEYRPFGAVAMGNHVVLVP